MVCIRILGKINEAKLGNKKGGTNYYCARHIDLTKYTFLLTFLEYKYILKGYGVMECIGTDGQHYAIIQPFCQNRHMKYDLFCKD